MNHSIASVIALFVVLIAGSNAIEPLPPCNDLIGRVSPCVGYLSKTESAPSSECCTGVKFLANYVNSKADRQSICRCLQSTASNFPQVDYSLFPSLTPSCGVDVSLPRFTPDFDCSKA